MNFPENKTLQSIFDQLANEQGLKDTSLLLDNEKEEKIKKIQKDLKAACEKDVISHTQKLSENQS